MIYFANFDGAQIATLPGVNILGLDVYTPPKRTLSINAIARSNRSKVSSAFWTEKRITLRVGVSGATRSEVESRMDGLFAVLTGLERELVIPQSGAARRYTATLTDAPILKSGGSYIELNLIFETSDRFGYDTTYISILNATGLTASSRTDAFAFTGSAPWQAPYLRYTYTGITGGSAGTVTISNNATGQVLSITRNWVTGDVLEIDAAARSVKVNNVEVAFTGAIPEFQPGQLSSIGYLDTFTTRTFNQFGYYYRRWQ